MRSLNQVKILLLGAGETGKSTFAKQMRIIYGEDFDVDDLFEFREIIYTNMIKAMQVLCDAREKLSIPWQDGRNEVCAQELLQWKIPRRLESIMFKDKVEIIKKLWNDSGIQKTYGRKREYQLVGIDFILKRFKSFIMSRKIAKIGSLVGSLNYQFLWISCGEC